MRIETILLCDLQDIANIVTIIGLIILIVSIYIAGKTYRQNSQINKMNFLLELHKMYLDDTNLLKIFNDIEWGENEQLERKFKDEYKLSLEKFFAFFEYSLVLMDKKIISEKEASIYNYMIEKVVRNEIIIQYFKEILLPHVVNSNLTNPYPKLKDKIIIK